MLRLNRAIFQFSETAEQAVVGQETTLLKAKWSTDAMSDLSTPQCRTALNTIAFAAITTSSTSTQHVSTGLIESENCALSAILLRDPRLAQVIKDGGRQGFFVKRIVVKMQARFRGKRIRLWMQRMEQSGRTLTAAEMTEMQRKLGKLIRDTRAGSAFCESAGICRCLYLLKQLATQRDSGME